MNNFILKKIFKKVLDEIQHVTLQVNFSCCFTDTVHAVISLMRILKIHQIKHKVNF